MAYCKLEARTSSQNDFGDHAFESYFEVCQKDLETASRAENLAKRCGCVTGWMVSTWKGSLSLVEQHVFGWKICTDRVWKVPDKTEDVGSKCARYAIKARQIHATLVQRNIDMQDKNWKARAADFMVNGKLKAVEGTANT